MSLDTDIQAPLASRDYLAAAQLVASYLDPHGFLGAKPSAGLSCAQVDLLFADGSELRIIVDARARYRIDVRNRTLEEGLRPDTFNTVIGRERGSLESHLCKLRLALAKSGLGEQGW